MIAGVQGTFRELLNHSGELSDLLGGFHHTPVMDESGSFSIQVERAAVPIFDMIVELSKDGEALVCKLFEVDTAVDLALQGLKVLVQQRSLANGLLDGDICCEMVEI